MDIEKAIRELAAKEAIRHCEYSYCRGVDRQDRDLLAGIFHPDATVDYSFFQGAASEFVRITNERFGEMWENPMHMVGNVFIELEGSVAYVESYCLDTLFPKGPTEGLGHGQRILHQWTVRYVSRYENRDDAWRIAHRHAIPEVRDVRISSGDASTGDPAYPQPTRYDRTDPSYQARRD